MNDNTLRPSLTSRRLFGTLLLFLFGFLLVLLPAQADVVILKDGYTLHGRLYKEKAPIYDSLSGAMVPSFKVNGLYIVDDGPRMQVFPATQRNLGAVEDNFNKFGRLETFTRQIDRFAPLALPTGIAFRSITEFNAQWNRTMRFDDLQNTNAYHDIRQKISNLTPHYIRIDSTSHLWSTYYLTKEWEPERVRALLLTHPRFLGMDKEAKLDIEKRLLLARFFLQADWLDQADRELIDAEKLFPAEKQKLDAVKEELRQERWDRLLSEIERSREAGRHAFAIRMLTQFPKEGLPARISVRVATLQAEYEVESKRFDLAKRYLTEIPERATSASQELREAVGAVQKELHPDTADRLELFVNLAEQVEKDIKAGRNPSQTSEQLLSLAVTGWLLGKNAAEPDPMAAVALWNTRKMSLSYLANPLESKRMLLLSDYEKTTNKVSFDQLERMISMLPPPEAATTFPTLITEKKTGPLPKISGGLTYHVQLPPEYTHSRSWPLLIVLGNGTTDRPELIMKRFGDLPARYGCITVGFDWGGALRNTYDYSSEEHEQITALMTHLRRVWQVNSDRVFLFGYGEGAHMALDVGASYPDQFAGVVAMTPTNPDWRIFGEYWRNYQTLPVYLIFGDKAGASSKTLRTLTEKWMSAGFPALGVSYKGRGPEWFGGELPYVFDWMSRKTRRSTPTTLGYWSLNSDGTEYRSMRNSDVRFWWMSTDELDRAFLLENRKNGSFYSGAKFTGRIGEGNAIYLQTLGMKRLSLSFSRGMIDLDRAVNITWNGKSIGSTKVVPKLSTILEDIYERGDRQRPVFGKVELR